MPLAFSSLSHGTVAFGFYNIETDGLLLDRLFFSCTDFCRAACNLERALGAGEPAAEMPGYLIEDPERIGDLHGAIQGIRHVGYLGEIYRRWPFPARPEDFRQRLDGARRREETDETLGRWGVPTAIRLAFDPRAEWYAIGPYLFPPDGYLDLLAYVWRGGYPTWEGFEHDRRPGCVAEMACTVGGLAARIRGAVRPRPHFF